MLLNQENQPVYTRAVSYTHLDVYKRQVLAYARKKRRFSFRQLLERQSDKLEIVVTFLAVLELMKIGKIHLTQEETFGDMDIEALEPEGMDEEPDLAELSDFEE